MLGDPVKRLEYILRNNQEPWFDKTGYPNSSYWALVDTVFLLLIAVGQPERGAEIYANAHEMVKYGEVMPVDVIVAAVKDLGNTPYDKFVPWTYREAQRAQRMTPIGYARFHNKFAKYAPRLATWQAATKADVMKMSAEDVFTAVDEWDMARAEETVYEFPNGWTVKRLVGPAALEREGERMHHCVKNPEYAEGVAAGESVIYSLRDPRNKPHVTLEWNPDKNHFEQMKMRDNVHPPSEEYRPMLVEFVQKVHSGEPVGLLLTGTPATELDLRGADLTDAQLDGADLTGADLTDAVLIRASLYDAILTGADLTNANLADANLGNATVADAILTDTVWAGTQVDGAVFFGSDLRGVDFRGAQGYPDLTGAKLDHTTTMPEDMKWRRPAGLGYYRRRRW